MSDPPSETIQRLQPRAVFSRQIEGAGDWAVRYGAFGQPASTLILAGEARLAVDACHGGDAEAAGRREKTAGAMSCRDWTLDGEGARVTRLLNG